VNKTRALSAAVLGLVLVAGLACKNRAPDVPGILSGPTFCFRDTTYTFKTTANDPDGDSVSVRMMWDYLSISDWSGWVASGDTVLLTHAWPNAGDYGVYAQARDQKLNTSGWSDTLKVQVVSRYPPGIPIVPIGPNSCGQDSSYSFATAASHPAGITVAVRFSWGDGDTANWSAFVASGETVAMSHVWTVPDTYAVAAQAKDTGNALSEWSAARTVVIRPPDTLRKWRFPLVAGDSFALYSSPAIGTDGVIYVGSADNSLYAVNPDGTLRWRYPTGGYVRSSPAVASDGTVYVGSMDSCLYALNPDGTLRWRYQTAGEIRSCPAIAADGTVCFGSYDDYFYALGADGTLKWRYRAAGSIISSPAIAADGTVYFGYTDDYLYAVSTEGTLQWRVDLGGNVESSPAIAADGTVYVGSNAGRTANFYALNPDGSLKWSYLADDDVRSSPALAADGTVYFGSRDRSFYAFNPDGTLKWSYRTGGRIWYSSPAVAVDGTVYIGSQDACIYAFYPDGTLKWSYPTGGKIETAPTIGSDGTVYFVSRDGYLYAYKGTSPLADSPWPKFHHDLRNTGRVGGGK
jgi:outer membrane protein assembly factor BamB